MRAIEQGRGRIEEVNLAEIVSLLRHLRPRQAVGLAGKLVGIALFFALIHSYFGVLVDAYLGRP